MTRRTRSVLLLLLLSVAVPAVAQAPRLSVDAQLGFAVMDRRHTINAAPAFFTPGIEVRAGGRFFAFAGVRALVFAIPIPGDGGDRVEDENGNSGLRDTGALGGGPWVRAGVGAALSDSPRSPTVSIAGGTMGLSDPHPWVGAAAGMPLRGAWSVEAELGWDRNWVEDRFFSPPPIDPGQPYQPGPGYTRREEAWFNTFQVGMRYRL